MVCTYKWFALAGALAFVLLWPAPVCGQYSLVNRARAETSDGLIFAVRVEPQVVTAGKNIVLLFSVRNNSTRAIYLVSRNETKFNTDGDSILVEVPLPIPVGHGAYDFKFEKVERGKVRTGKIIIPSHIYSQDDFWPIDVGFGYVTDISGLLRKPGKDEDPSNLRGLLYERLNTIVVGKLSVKIRQR